MTDKKLFSRIVILLLGIILAAGCNQNNEKVNSIPREPVIEPDYSGVTIPENIAPLNFKIKEEGRKFRILVNSPAGVQISLRTRDGIVRFPGRSWRKLLKSASGDKISISVFSEDKIGNHTQFNPVSIIVAGDPVDPYLCYRFLYPGYEAYLRLKIVQRNTESFSERSLAENQLLSTNCINCHSFQMNNADKYLIHVRGSLGGTYFAEGNKIIRRDLKTPDMNYGAVYPAWHPRENLVAFSSNSIVQSFHASQEYNIEVTDLASSLVIYDAVRNEMSPVPENDSVRYMDTFPEWSPDGDYLYFCRARQPSDSSDFEGIKYNLVKRTFNPATFSFGKAELVFDAQSIGKSASFPRISPDGRYLVFTLHDYGNFSIWHKEADLYLIDIGTGNTKRLEINSNETESYHSWSSNSKWLVFSSKRDDGLTARPYFAYIGSKDLIGKPFVLPQRDPELYQKLVKTFNKPEFVNKKINAGPRDFERASGKDAVKAIWAGNKGQVRGPGGQ